MKLDSEPVYGNNDKYIKTYRDKIKTIFKYEKFQKKRKYFK